MSDEETEIPVEELAEEADAKVEALIELLIEKGVITEEEFSKKWDSYFEDEEVQSE